MGWKDSKIQFKNCFVSRRPRNQQFFKKRGDDTTNQLKLDEVNKDNIEFDDGNYTQFDLTIEEVNISLSFSKWLSGKGIIKECSIKGLRGLVDRTHVHWLPGDKATNYKNISRPGDWEIENLKMEDVLFTMMNPNGFKTFQVSIYNAEVPIFRKNWLMFDMLNSKHISGCYDGSLFTINRIQRVDDFKEEMKINNEVKLINKNKNNNDVSVIDGKPRDDQSTI
ncbi:unnamed protein product [Ambrosiozyma monospora]|uniref:Unnamed protein product n=1 Tax=Ambrosiozyma monospora TaxID=43982 RepID=A0ACB5U5F0_AMBMO|nr:unnamed protein product [Ambrosiozyma monospora]